MARSVESFYPGACAPVPANLVSWWRLDGGAGDIELLAQGVEADNACAEQGFDGRPVGRGQVFVWVHVWGA